MTEHDDHGEPVIEPEPGEPARRSVSQTDPLVGSGNEEPVPIVDTAASTLPGSSTAPPGDPGDPSAGSPVPPPGERPGWSLHPMSPWAPPGADPFSSEDVPLQPTEPTPVADAGFGLPPASTWTPPPAQGSDWSPPPPPSQWTPAAPGPERPRSSSSARAALVGGLVGALVAALVTAGAFLIFGRDHDSSSASSAPLRPASVIVHDGDIQSILRKVQPAVVRIDVDAPDGTGTGTGFIVAKNGVIVTNAHVAADAFSIRVTLNDSRKATASVIGIDRSHDLAVVKIGLTNLPVVELGDSDSVEVGDSVVAIGNALALEGTPTVTSGIVSALHRTISTEESTQLTDVIQTDAAINPGNSGGPLLDSEGRVIGINTAIASPADANNIGFAIAISSAEPTLKRLESGENAPAQSGFLGVLVESVDSSIASAQNLSVTHGALVTNVTAASPASRAGLKVGDVVVKLDSTTINTASQLTKAVQAHKPGTEVTVVVNRSGATRTFHVRLATRPTS